MRYVDLFCGAGGTSCGLARAGWECVGAADVDATALATYALNFPRHPTHRLDLSQPLPDAPRDEWRAALADGALVGSSPCTDFSTANSAPRDRSALTVAFAHLTATLRPRVVRTERKVAVCGACTDGIVDGLGEGVRHEGVQ